MLARRSLATITAAILAVITAVVPAAAQSGSPSPTSETPWDATGIVGLFNGRPETPAAARYGDHWFHTGQGGVALGRHFTPHLKAEVEVLGTGEGRRFVERTVTVSGYPYPYPVGSEVHSSVQQVVGAVTWQFFENEWVHPFVQVGIAVDRERMRVRTWRQELFTGTPTTPGSRITVSEDSTSGPDTTVHARPTIAAGVKMYFSPRGFVRTDARYAAGSSAQSLSLRIGLGLDF